MIERVKRRLGLSPFVLVFAGLALISLLLSRGAGSGWLIVVAAAFLGVLFAALLWSAAGLVGVRVDLVVPTDVVVGETFAVDIRVQANAAQLRTVRLRNLDDSTHAVDGATPTRIFVAMARRCLLPALEVEVRGGLPLGLFRFARVSRVQLPTALAVGPVPAAVSLLDAIGEDAAAEVRTVRSYVPGDPARHVHWRSTARRGELMVREMESAELLRGASLALRVSLPDDAERAEAVASEAAGLALAALDAGVSVTLATVDESGDQTGVVLDRRGVNRRLAAAVPGAAPVVSTDGRGSHMVELPR